MITLYIQNKSLLNPQQLETNFHILQGYYMYVFEL